MLKSNAAFLSKDIILNLFNSGLKHNLIIKSERNNKKIIIYTFIVKENTFNNVVAEIRKNRIKAIILQI